MSRFDKLIARFKSRPKDFAWNELVRMLNAFGYSEVPTGKTGGSRRQFRCDGRKTIDLQSLILAIS